MTSMLSYEPKALSWQRIYARNVMELAQTTSTNINTEWYPTFAVPDSYS